MPASVSILMRQLPAMRLICIALISVILTLFRCAATSGLNLVNTPVMGRAMARRNISRRVKVVMDDRLQQGGISVERNTYAIRERPDALNKTEAVFPAMSNPS